MNRNVDTWEANAQVDPLFAILTDETKRASWNIDDFFASGEEEISRVLSFMAKMGIEPNRAGRFLDFGCGVGRNTRALMRRFGTGIGLDVSETMITHARRYAETDATRADYLVNSAPNLNALSSASIDFVYSHIVLQHLPSALQRQYISEFMRVLTPNGIAAFQIPTGWLSRDVGIIFRMLTPHWLKNAIHTIAGHNIRMQMHTISPAAIKVVCASGAGTIVCAPYSNSTEKDCNGKVEFMDRGEAVRRIRAGAAKSHYLSQFFFVRRSVT